MVRRTSPARGTRPRGQWAAAGLIGVTLACSRQQAGDAPPEPRLDEAVPPPLVSSSAFDLAPAATGALLAWAPEKTGRILRRRFDAHGIARAPDGADVTVERDVNELALASSDAGEVLAWSEGGPVESTIRAVWIHPDGSSRRFELGAGAAVQGRRGGLSLSARGSEALLFARGGATVCDVRSTSPCTAFQLWRLSANGSHDARLPLAVPSPCADQAAQLVLAPGQAPGAGDGIGRFDYAICSRSGPSSVLTVFSIQPSPAYAAAEEVFAGCTPLGAGRFAGRATFVAACGASRRLATVPGGGESLVVRELDRRGLVCRNGSASLAFGDGWLALNEPLGQLQLLLDEHLAPSGARAVWSGAALLVARRDDAARLRVASYACSGDVLLERGEWTDAEGAGSTRGRH